MNLEEKKLVQATQSAIEPTQAKLDALTGQALPLEIDWETFSGAPDAIKAVPRAVSDIEKGLAELCKDDLGKQALKEKLAKLRLVQKADQLALGQTAKIAESVLTIEADFRRMGFRPDHLSKHLAKQL
jgi:hypothetical protein